MRIVGASSWAAEFITRHPVLLDELLDDRLLYAPPDLETFARRLRAQLAAHADDRERRMVLLRELHRAQVFRLLAQDLAGLLTVERLADHLSALADLVLQVTIEAAWDELPRRRERAAALRGHRLWQARRQGARLRLRPGHRVPLRRSARAGAGGLRTPRNAPAELDHDPHLGRRALRDRSPAAAERHLGAHGFAGRSFRALPGARRLGLGSTEALTRARFSAGERSIGAAFEAIRERILRRPRNADELRKQIAEMRAKLHARIPTAPASSTSSTTRAG